MKKYLNLRIVPRDKICISVTTMYIFAYCAGRQRPMSLQAYCFLYVPVSGDIFFCIKPQLVTRPIRAPCGSGLRYLEQRNVYRLHTDPFSYVGSIVTTYEVWKVRCGATYCTSTQNTPYSTLGHTQLFHWENLFSQ